MYKKLIDDLTLRLQQALPSAAAHEVLRARHVGEDAPVFKHSLPPRPGSVLILLYEEDGVIKFPLTKRAEYLGTHSGQISLPGGKAESGETPIETALREAEEEIGLNRNLVTIVGRLSNFFVIPSNFMVTPIVGTVTSKPDLKADPREVSRILTGTLPALLAKDAIKEKEILVANRYRMLAPHFEIDHEIVWGATAMILNELRLILQEISTPQQ